MRKSARALLLLLFAIFFFAEFLLFIYLCLFQFYRPLLILADGSSNPHIQQKIQTQYRDSSRSAAKIHFAAIVWIGKYASTFADIFRFRSIRNSHALIVVKNEILFEFECSSCQRIYYWSQQSWIVVWFYLFFAFNFLLNFLDGLWSWIYNIFAILQLCLFSTLKQLNFSSLNRIISIQFLQTMQFPSTELFHWKNFFLFLYRIQFSIVSNYICPVILFGMAMEWEIEWVG